MPSITKSNTGDLTCTLTTIKQIEKILRGSKNFADRIAQDFQRGQAAI